MTDLQRQQAAAASRLADLRRELEGLEQATAEGPDDEHDPEGSTIGFERARIGGLIERTVAELADLAEAEDRVVDGTYGTCERCGDAIPGERLAALPATRRCVRCAGR